MGFSSQQILLELSENNDFFDMLVDMIPSKLYIAGNSGDDFNPSKYMKKQAAKESREARRAAAKLAKRRKLNPSQAVGTVETKKRLEADDDKEGAEVVSVLPTKKDADKKDTVKEATANETTSPHQSRIEALRAKLHAKIAEKRGQRPLNPDQVSKRAARRADKSRRQEQAKRKAATSTTTTTPTNKYTVVSPSKDDDPAADLVNLDFGRLSGLKSDDKEHYMKSNKALANLSKTKNLQKMLADAEAKRLKLEELKKGSVDDQAKAAAMQWSDTFKEADGTRIKDDPAKLKKALKRKAAKKTKSQKAWKTRMEQTQEKMADRQKIRQHNLKARKQGGRVGANLSKKRIEVATEDEGRRLSRAGFEGRKQEFLNSGKE